MLNESPKPPNFPPSSAASPAPASIRIADVPEDMRPREKMRSGGPEALSDAELLALFFGSGTRGLNVIDMSRQLIEKYGGLQGLSRQPHQELQKQLGIGKVKALHLAAIFELGRRFQHQRYVNREISASEHVNDLIGTEMRILSTECLKVVLVSAKLTLIRVLEVHRGSIDQVQAHVRSVMKPVIGSEAHGFFLAHNHPSGDPTPSPQDRRFTSSLRDACRLMEIPMLDHIIIGTPTDANPKGYFSFRDTGLL
jgi:DNA repair protein RadC